MINNQLEILSNLKKKLDALELEYKDHPLRHICYSEIWDKFDYLNIEITDKLQKLFQSLQ